MPFRVYTVCHSGSTLFAIQGLHCLKKQSNPVIRFFAFLSTLNSEHSAKSGQLDQHLCYTLPRKLIPIVSILKIPRLVLDDVADQVGLSLTSYTGYP